MSGPALLVPLVAFLAVQISRLTVDDLLLFYQQHVQPHWLPVAIVANILAFVAVHLLVYRKPRVLLVDFTCFRPPAELAISRKECIEFARRMPNLDEKCVDFQIKVVERSGLGDETVLPKCLRTFPINPCLTEARLEAELVVFGTLDQLFARTGVKPTDVSILVVNCSIFCPTPSLSAMVVNKYGMRSDIQSYNLGGMGCSAGLIAVKLAQDLLQASSKGTYAVVVSTENISQNIYLGKRRSMAVANCLFRVGGAAMLLTNKSSERYRAKYELSHVVRTHLGKQDKCYRCVYQEEDDEGIVGVALSRDLMSTAGDALKTNITTLGPLVLPLSEKLLFAANLVARKFLGFKKSLKPYTPDFKMAFEHFCIHAGGRAVIDELEKNLELSNYHTEPSRMTLYRFGNTSSSSVWYELSYSEAQGRVRAGDRVWQIAFGSGFKCQSAVWRALRRVVPEKNRGPWGEYYGEGGPEKLAAAVADAEAPVRPIPGVTTE